MTAPRRLVEGRMISSALLVLGPARCQVGSESQANACGDERRCIGWRPRARVPVLLRVRPRAPLLRRSPGRASWSQNSSGSGSSWDSERPARPTSSRTDWQRRSPHRACTPRRRSVKRIDNPPRCQPVERARRTWSLLCRRHPSTVTLRPSTLCHPQRKAGGRTPRPQHSALPTERHHRVRSLRGYPQVLPEAIRHHR